MPGQMVMGRAGRTNGTGIPGPMAGVGMPVRTGRTGRARGLVGGNTGIAGNAGLRGLIGGEVGLIGGDGSAVGEKVTLRGLVGGEVIGILVEGGGFSDVESANGSTIGFLTGMKGGCTGVGRDVPDGWCCTGGACMAVPMGGGGRLPIGGRGAAPTVEVGLED